MNIKLIAIDLDHTLINEEKDFSKRDLAAIEKAREKGIYVCLASGRTFKSLRPYYDRLGFDTMTISAGGAAIFDKDNKLVYKKFLPEKEAAEIVKFAHQNGYYAQVYFDDDFYFFEEDSEYSRFYEENCGTPGILDKKIIEMDEISTPKVLFIDTPERINQIMAEMKEKFAGVTVKKSYPYYLEINNKEASKGRALEELGEIVGVEREEIMAIGDSEIDVSMIEYAKMGVVMGNAEDEIKKHADFITADCDDDGVAAAIEKFCL